MSYNVFADMGFPNPEEELAKARLVHCLRELIEDKRLTEQRAAALFGLTPPELSRLLWHGGWGDYSVEQLRRFICAVDPDAVLEDEEAQTLALTA